jgi:hypothetical protein
MKQTAVEWLEDEIRWYISNDERLYDMFKKAKQMEKEQMIELWNIAVTCESFEQYYTETFKTETIVTEYKDGTIKVETFKSE